MDFGFVLFKAKGTGTRLSVVEVTDEDESVPVLFPDLLKAILKSQAGKPLECCIKCLVTFISSFTS